MPIVFVHGVNNRSGAAYHETESSRGAFLREIVAPALEIAPADVFLSSPYWGDSGARFAWDLAVLPTADEGYEAFGGTQEAMSIHCCPRQDRRVMRSAENTGVGWICWGYPGGGLRFEVPPPVQLIPVPG